MTEAHFQKQPFGDPAACALGMECLLHMSQVEVALCTAEILANPRLEQHMGHVREYE